jgi:hypothetical protein
LATTEVALIGGPYDGAVIKERAAEFVYVGGATTSRPELPPLARGFLLPGEKRALYRRVDDVFLTVDYTYVRCEGCEGFSMRSTRCQGCGQPITT